MSKPLSPSRIVRMQLEDILEEIWLLKRGKNYVVHDVVTAFLDHEKVGKLLDEVRRMVQRTDATVMLRRIIKRHNDSDVEQYELDGMTVEMVADYVVPAAPPAEGDEPEDADADADEAVASEYHAPRSLLTVAEQARHQRMRKVQEVYDGIPLRRETQLKLLLEEARAGPDEKVIDVLARLARKGDGKA